MSLLSPAQLARTGQVRQGRMTDKCTTKRVFTTTKDPLGQPVKTFSNYLENQKCFFEPIVQKRAGEQLTEDREYTIERYKLEMPVGTDIIPQDQVTNLLDQANFYKQPGNPVYEVKKVVPFLTYLEVSLELIN